MNVEGSGNRIWVELFTKGNQKLVKFYENGKVQNYQYRIEIEATDIVNAKDIQSKIPRGSAPGFPLYLSLGEVGFRFSRNSGEVKYRISVPDDHRDETGEIPLWLCPGDSRFQEILYSVFKNLENLQTD